MSESGKTGSPANFHTALRSLLSEVKTFTADFSEEAWMATTAWLVFNVNCSEEMLTSKRMKLHGCWLSFCMRVYLFLCEIGD